MNRDIKGLFVVVVASALACTVGKDGKQGDPGVPCSGCVNSASLAPGAVSSAALGDGVVKTANIGAKAVTGAQIADGAVDAIQLAPNSVGTATVADGTITASKLAAGAVTGASIAASSVPGSAIDPATSITATQFVFAAPKPRRVSVQAYGFVPQNDTVTWDGSALAGNGFRALTGGGPFVAAAAVAFPDGATLTNLTARVFDGSATLHVTVHLRRFDGLGASEIGAAGSTDAETGGFLTKTAALSHAVDNSGTSAYFLVWEVNGAGTSSSGPGLYSASVDYTYTSP